MNIGELFVEIGTKGDSKALKQFTKSVQEAGEAIEKFNERMNENIDKNGELAKKIKGTVSSILGIATAVAGAYWALDRLTNSLVKQNQQWLNLTRQSDIALSTFQKWGTIGKIVGVDNAEQQLESLNEKLFNLRLTGEGARGFQLAGVLPTNAEDVLEQLRNRISGMSNTSATYLLQQMGLDPKMITLLRMGRKEWEQYIEISRKYTLTDKQRESIDIYNRQLEVARIKMKYFKDRAILALMPAFTMFTQSIARVTELLIKFIDKSWRFIGIISLWISRFKIVRDIFASVSSALGNVITRIPIVGRLFAQLGRVFSKVLFPLTALYLLLDDLAVFFEGGDSLIGRVLEWGKGKFGEIGDAFSKMFGGEVLNGLYDLVETLLDTFNESMDVIRALLEGLLNFLTFGLWQKFKDSKVGDFLFGNNLDKLLMNDGIDPSTGKRFTSNMTSGAKYFTNSRNQNTNITQDIKIWTNESVSSIGDNLRYAQRTALQG